MKFDKNMKDAFLLLAQNDQGEMLSTSEGGLSVEHSRAQRLMIMREGRIGRTGEREKGEVQYSTLHYTSQDCTTEQYCSIQYNKVQ